MAVTILFNVLKAFSRFRLWRIDSTREKLETALKELVDPELTHAQIRAVPAEKVMAALTDAARRGGPAYGDDLQTKLVERRFAEVFERKVAVFFVATGTAANALSLAAYARPGAIAFARSLPLATARQPDVLLCYRMNGADLNRAHGFPLRAIVPGWYGMASVKWLTRIELRRVSYRY